MFAFGAVTNNAARVLVHKCLCGHVCHSLGLIT